MLRTILFPGFLRSKSFYKSFTGIDIWQGEKIPGNINEFDFIIGSSLGARLALSCLEKNFSGALILVNPPVDNNRLKALFFFWRPIFKGFFKRAKDKAGRLEDLVSRKYWFENFILAFRLYGLDFFSLLDKFPRQSIFIIRGRYDQDYCHEKAVVRLKERGFNVIEVEAGHFWNDTIEQCVRSIINE